MPREAVRMFGVELEGFFDTDLEDGCFNVGETEWHIREDGSLGRNGLSCCSECDGDGHIQCSCPDCAGEGQVTITDSTGEEFEANCVSCNGSGDSESTCEACGGEGYTRHNRSSYGLEVVSPPITDLDLIYDVYGKMYEYDWHINNNAGLHIHVDARDLTPKDFYKVLLLMTVIDPVLYAISDIYRHRNCQYSLPLTDADYGVRTVLNRQYEDIDKMSQVMFTNDRYISLNFNAFRRHQTIEFRHFSPQMDASDVIERVELVTRLVDFAKHASYEQLYVVYSRMLECRPSFDNICDILQEILALPYDLKSLKQNDHFSLFDRVAVDVSHNQAESVQFEEVV